MYTVSFDMEIPNISGTTESKDQFLGKYNTIWNVDTPIEKNRLYH